MNDFNKNDYNRRCDKDMILRRMRQDIARIRAMGNHIRLEDKYFDNIMDLICEAIVVNDSLIDQIAIEDRIDYI